MLLSATISHFFILVFNLCLPLNRCLPVCLQVFVGAAEVLVAKETIIG
mgnify:FL=1|jgi:hypothetical protein